MLTLTPPASAPTPASSLPSEQPVEGGLVVTSVEELAEALQKSPVDAVLLDEACGTEMLTAAARVLPKERLTTFLLVERCCLSSLDLLLQLDLDGLAPRGTPARELRSIIDRYVAARRSGEPDEHRDLFPGFIGRGAWLEELCAVLPRLARASASVLVQGETGTGKELVARAIHRLSPRRHEPFQAVNCGAIPEHLIESDLFGHEKGAFTGATASKLGRFEMAHRGTLFLDEIGELSEGAQAKLLRALQEGSIDRVGGEQSTAVDVRIVAATNRALELDAGGALRADLLFRLQVLSVRLPPLRERTEDVVPLWLSFVEQERRKAGAPPLFTHPSVSAALLAHPWPGNVRELQNAAIHAATLADDVIERRHLPPVIAGASAVEVTPRIQVPGMSLKEIERIVICETLKSTSTIRAAAEMLGVSRRTIQYRLSEYRDGDDELGSLQLDEEAPDEELAPRPRPRLLLAEDDNDLRQALEAVLVHAGYEVVALESGAAVLQYLGAAFLLDQWRGAPDVIVTDIRMPGMTGMQLLEGMRTNGWNVPVIVMSAFADDDVREQARALGAAAFLDKPLDGRKVERAVASALRREGVPS